MPTQEWYVAIATAIQKRDHARTMAGKWEEKVAEAEAQIEQLTAQQDAPPPEQEQPAV